MFRPLVMPGGHPVRVVVAPGCASAMHGAGHDRNCGPAHRRDPRREKSDEQIDREKSTHHAANLQLANRFRFTKHASMLGLNLSSSQRNGIQSHDD